MACEAVTLLDLPKELLDKIASVAGLFATISLRESCRSLYHVVEPSKLAKLPLGMKELLLLELSEEASDLFACGSCLKLRHANHFTTASITGTRGNRARPKRFCIDCGIITGRIKPTRLAYFGLRRAGCGRVCTNCFGFHSINLYWPDPPCDMTRFVVMISGVIYTS